MPHEAYCVAFQKDVGLFSTKVETLVHFICALTRSNSLLPRPAAPTCLRIRMSMFLIEMEFSTQPGAVRGTT